MHKPKNIFEPDPDPKKAQNDPKKAKKKSEKKKFNLNE